jgi:hypothetical protein
VRARERARVRRAVGRGGAERRGNVMGRAERGAGQINVGNAPPVVRADGALRWSYRFVGSATGTPALAGEAGFKDAGAEDAAGLALPICSSILTASGSLVWSSKRTFS